MCTVDLGVCAIDDGMSTVDPCVGDEWLIHIFYPEAVEQGEYTVSLMEIVVDCEHSVSCMQRRARL